MYQVLLKGCFETEDPDKFISDIKKIASEDKADLVGSFSVYQLPPYVDCQKCDIQE